MDKVSVVDQRMTIEDLKIIRDSLHVLGAAANSLADSFGDLMTDREGFAVREDMFILANIAVTFSLNQVSGSLESFLRGAAASGKPHTPEQSEVVAQSKEAMSHLLRVGSAIRNTMETLTQEKKKELMARGVPEALLERVLAAKDGDELMEILKEQIHPPKKSDNKGFKN